MHYTTIFSSAAKCDGTRTHARTGIEEAFKAIRTGSYHDPKNNITIDLKAITEEARGIYNQHGKSPEYRKEKGKLPVYTIHGSFPKNVCGEDIQDYQDADGVGLIFVDLDVDDPKAEDIDIEYIKTIPSLYAFHRSTSGKGYSLIFRAKNYSPAEIPEVIRAISSKYGLNNCENAMKVNQSTYLTYAPDLFVKTYVLGTGTDNDSEKYVLGVYDFSLYRVNGNDSETCVLGSNKEKKEDISTLNIHFNENSKLAYENTLPDWKEGERFRFISEGHDHLKINVGFRLKDGYRTKRLLGIAAALVALNSEAGELHLINALKKINRYRCDPPLPDEKVEGIMQSMIKRRKENKLDVSKFIKTRYIWFNPAANLCEEEKKEIAKVYGPAAKRAKKIRKINEAIQYFYNQERKITQENVAKLIGCQPGTLREKRRCEDLEFNGKSYWSFFKKEVKELNETTKQNTKGTKKKRPKPSKAKVVPCPAAEEKTVQEPVKQAVQEDEPVADSFTDERVEFIRALITKGLAEEQEEKAKQPVEHDPEPEQTQPAKPSIFDNHLDLDVFDCRLLFTTKNGIKIHLNHGGEISATFRLMEVESINITHLKNDEQRIRNFSIEEFFQQLDQPVVQEDEQVLVGVGVKERIEGIQALFKNEFVENYEQDLEPEEEVYDPVKELKEKTLEERTELVFQYLKTIRFKSLHVVKTKAEAVERSLYLKEVDGDLHIFRLGEEGCSDPLNGEEMYRKWLKEQAGIVEEVEELPF